MSEPLKTVDDQGRSIKCEFHRLNAADQAGAERVAQWLRNLAEEVLDPTFRAKLDDVFTAGYCQPLEQS